MDKKKIQLGMNPSTASNRLVKDILWDFILKSNQNYCYHCKGSMTRDNFSIEHKIPWLDSECPVDLFFDLNNISFSHHKCNIEARRMPRASCGTASKYSSGCRCVDCKAAHKEAARKSYSSEYRRKRYVKIGK